MSVSLGLWPIETSPLEEAWRYALQPVATRPVAMVEWQKDPVGWAVKFMGIPEHTIRWSLGKAYKRHKWDGDRDPLVQIAAALAAFEDVGVESGTGTGKSFWVAVLILWFQACFDGARTFTFAPKEDQLRKYIWTEIGKLWARFQRLFPTATLSDLKLRMIPGSEEWGAFGVAVGVGANEEVASKAAGMHARYMQLIYEETQGVPKAVMAAGENTAIGPYNVRIAIGNPDHRHDSLHEFCVSPGVKHVRISALDHPNVVLDDAEVVPGAVWRGAIQDRIAKYGLGSRMVLTKVHGMSPPEAADALIRYEWIEAAVARGKDREQRADLLASGFPARGVDVANSENGDQAAIARGIGAVLLEVPAFQCPNAMKLGSRLGAELVADEVDERYVGVDSVGVGSNVVNKLRELGLWIVELEGGPTSSHPSIDEDVLRERGKGIRQAEVFESLRMQMWWQMRMDLQHGRIALPEDPELHQDLLTPTWKTRNGKIWVEPKEDQKKRLGRSPNKGDAAVYWNWVRFRRAIKQEEQPLRAWDPGALEHEAREGRRVKTPKPIRDRRVNPLNVEHIP